MICQLNDTCQGRDDSCTKVSKGVYREKFKIFSFRYDGDFF